MFISRPEFSESDNVTTVSVKVSSGDHDRHLWFSVDSRFSSLISPASDAFLIALFIPAMAEGETIEFESPASSRLLSNLNGVIQDLVIRVIPWLERINVSGAAGDSQAMQPGVAAGFSGGIDSFSFIKDNLFNGASQRDRVTHLLFNNVGSHTAGKEALFEKRFKRLEPLIRDWGLPFVSINSNMDQFYTKPGLNFLQTHTFRNAAVGHLLKKGIGTFHYASSYDYSDLSVRQDTDIGLVDPLILPLLSNPQMDLVAAGWNLSRIEKTCQVSEFEASYRYLDVCGNPFYKGSYTNCSECEKCLRTMATLDLAGALYRYSEVFDLDSYRERKNRYLYIIRFSEDPLHIGICEFAKKQGYKTPLLWWMRSWLLRLPKQTLLGLWNLLFHDKKTVKS